MALYKQLNTARNEIRLIRMRVVPDVETCSLKIECRFQIASLLDKPVYDALSYTWGKPCDWSTREWPDETIYVEGHATRVTGNLFCALLTIWQSCRPSPVGALWVDALCIKQDDREERSSQVRLMASIYSHARRVRIWLGPGSHQVNKIFIAAEDGSLGELVICEPSTWREGFLQIVCSHWWRRLWIVQEAVLATDAIVHCAMFTIPWKRLISALLALYKETNAMSIADSTTKLLEGGGHRALLSLMLLGSLFREHPVASRDNLDIQYVLSLLSKLSRQEVSDDRDRVYGALGMLPEQLNIVPDYNLSTLEVYQAFTERLIKWSGSLDILRLCDNVDEKTSWPSWVPGLRGLLHSVQPVMHLYGASGKASPFARIKKGTELFVRAHVVDRIAFAEEFRSNNDEDPLRKDILSDSHKQYVRRCYGAAVTSDNPLILDRAECRARFWSTFKRQISAVVVDPTKGVVQQLDERALHEELDSWLSGNLGALSEEARAFMRTTQLMSMSVAFAVTENGYMVHSTERAPQIGDELVIIAGCSDPMLLRPVLGTSRNTYRVVAPCFCHELELGRYVRFACRAKARPQQLAALEPPLEECLHATYLLHSTSFSYIHVKDLRATRCLLEEILSLVLESETCGAVGSAERAFARSCLKMILADVQELFTQRQEIISVADRWGSRFEAYSHDECVLYLSTIGGTFTVAYADHKSLSPPMAFFDQGGQREALEVILCATSLIILEGLIWATNVIEKHVKVPELEKGGMIIETIEELVGRGPQEAVQDFYRQLKRLAQQEAEAERFHTTLFDGLILV